jgi:YidC/Oxa1 family membrane protein insertase
LPEFRNPNQGSGGGGSQDNRSFLVMLIVFGGVLLGLQLWRGKSNPQTESPSAPAAVTQSASQPAGTAPVSSTVPAASATTPVRTVQTVQAGAESTTVVENELYRITFSNRGAEVRSWVLKNTKDNDGKPLDMVHDGASKQFGYPLSLHTYDSGVTKSLADALYVPSATGNLQSPATLSFDYSAGNIKVHKTFTFGADYVIHAEASVLRDGAPIRALLSWPAALGDMENQQAYAGSQVDTNSNGKTEHISAKSVSGGATLNGPFNFAAVSDQYFAAVFMPDEPAEATVATLHNEIDVAKVQRHTGLGQGSASSSSKPVPVPILGVAIGNLSGYDKVRLFVGPKGIQVLKNVHTSSGDSLEPLLDFGFWGIIGKWLFYGLQAVHSLLAPAVGSPHDYSWGWAIVWFTVLINLVLLPLRVQSMRSALKMQRLQPQIDQIKAKYKNPKATDPKMAQMNAEVMQLQKDNGVSMFGGCVPSLVQLPLLFAFFTMMTKVVELRQAHWYWLHDLSAADPYHILPIILLVTSFLVQFYTPSPGVDRQQQRMMAIMMPMVSLYITWNYASGLAIYWTVGNFIMILQQLVMNRTSLGKEMKELAAKRARRKAVTGGSGKTIQGRR